MHVGFGNVVSSGKIQMILTPGTAVGRRLIKAAKDKSLYLDLTAGRTTKAIILMEDGKLIGSAITPRTLAQRIHTLGANENIEEGEQENEADEADSIHFDA